jgi:peptidoglycan/LPS O-acetylase OafA/YrhL
MSGGGASGDRAGAREDAVGSNDRTRALEAAATRRPPPRWSLAAGALLMLAVAVLTAAQWELVAPTTAGRDNSFRDTGLAILLGLAGLRMLTSRGGRHRVATAVALLAGLGLVLAALLTGHDRTGLAVVEAACGALAVLCAVACWVRP